MFVPEHSTQTPTDVSRARVALLWGRPGRACSETPVVGTARDLLRVSSCAQGLPPFRNPPGARRCQFPSMAGPGFRDGLTVIPGLLAGLGCLGMTPKGPCLGKWSPGVGSGGQAPSPVLVHPFKLGAEAVCVCLPTLPAPSPAGLHQRPQEVPAVLQGLRPLHCTHAEPPHHWLSLQETGPPAQVSPAWWLSVGTGMGLDGWWRACEESPPGRCLDGLCPS